MKILSLGWGVQSFTLAVMSALGDFEKPDFAIHADTTHEASWTYEFAWEWTPWLEERGIKVITVSPAKNKLGELNNNNGIYIPAFTVGKNGAGQLMRQCTGDWKISPMRRWMQEHRNGEGVELWIGISLDEFQRMKPSDVKYITNRHPLIEKRLSRNDCIKYLKEHGIAVPYKSSCSFCPYHDTKEWRFVMAHEKDRLAAIKQDQTIRNLREEYKLFIHPSRKPIDEVDFRTAEEKGQLSLWDNECFGICGV